MRTHKVMPTQQECVSPRVGHSMLIPISKGVAWKESIKSTAVIKYKVPCCHLTM